MCLGALDKGFCMDELPLNSTDSNEVRTIINNLLRSKERRENVGDKHDSYGSKISTDPGKSLYFTILCLGYLTITLMK